MTTELRMLGYVRVSTTEQAADGHGLNAQAHQIQEAADQNDRWDLSTILREEGVSAKSLDRPVLMFALSQVAAGRADGVIVSKLDRLTRSVVDFVVLLDWFVRADAALVVLDLQVDTSTPAGRLVANVMACFAEWEREVIVQRTREGLAEARRRGVVFRPAVVDRPEVVNMVRRLRGEGLSLWEIAGALDDAGVPTARGAVSWQPSSVRAALGWKRPRAVRRQVALPKVERGR